MTVVDPGAARRELLLQHIAIELATAGFARCASQVSVCAALEDVAWDGVALVVECITERLDAKQALFAELEAHAPADAVLASNSSGFPISAIASGLPTAQRMLGLHFSCPPTWCRWWRWCWESAATRPWASGCTPSCAAAAACRCW